MKDFRYTVLLAFSCNFGISIVVSCFSRTENFGLLSCSDQSLSLGLLSTSVCWKDRGRIRGTNAIRHQENTEKT